eukprot:TRINITY_DN19447_c0_g1_i1.p1 TRINITY_DN19447_c0_g1~~TRINITY_DN19447_c0_g1_i1.p1  ORF type:complete len:753 (+),score=121.75 TRINITY_DN19447_c0_g1_i1:125-2383(+)
MVNDDSSERICDPGQHGLFLYAPETVSKPDFLYGLLYAVLLVYFFLGISIIADTFVGSITVITSRRSQKRMSDGNQCTNKVWNETVATLTLMALGSSAPEIFLSVIDTFKKGFHSGNVGPYTIVGSASFNLCIIVAVCIVAVPCDEDRKIKNMRGFFVTAIFSTGAYMWMVFVLVINTKDIIDVWEAAVTVALLPALVWIAYSVEVGALSGIVDKLNFKWMPLEPKEEKTSIDGSDSTIFFPSDFIDVVAPKGDVDIEVTVLRSGNLDSEETCSYCTENFSAIGGYDYEEAQGTLTFPCGQAEVTFTLKVFAKLQYRITRDFLVILSDPSDGLQFCEGRDGYDDDCTILTVRVHAHKHLDSDIRLSIDRWFNVNGLHRANSDYLQQFVSALYVNGSLEEQEEASKKDWFFHIFCVPWNLVFAIVPPPSYAGGWICFVVSIIYIGLLTGLVSDLSELFGCVLDVPDVVTATTFVSLGTSMPDLFASLSAAREDPTADASIVNVTGSNSVNVFLGLGVPWVVSALYWAFAKRTDDWALRYEEIAEMTPPDKMVFVVPSQNLGFCVLVFTACSGTALLFLILRRRLMGFELGGPRGPAYATATLFVALWSAFVILAAWRALRCPGASKGHLCRADATEQAMMGVAVFGIVFLVSLWPMASYWRHRIRTPPKEEEAPQTITLEACHTSQEDKTCMAAPKQLLRGDSKVSAMSAISFATWVSETTTDTPTLQINNLELRIGASAGCGVVGTTMPPGS